MEKLFVYGTLQDPNVQQKVIGRVTELTDAILENYMKREVIINGTTYPIAMPSDGETVSGKILEVTPEELILIDEYETVSYKRVEVELASGAKTWLYCQH